MLLVHDIYMPDTLVLNAHVREERGRKANALRKTGKTPAILYGLQKDPAALTIDTLSFVKLYDAAGTSTLIDVVVDGGAPEKALIGEIQTHPVTDRLQHVDLKRVDMSVSIFASVPLEFVGESSAVKNLGGTLTTQIDELEVECLPADLPSSIEIDISILATFDDAIYVRDLKISDTIRVETDGNQLIAAVNPPRSEKELEDLNAAVVEDVSTVGVIEKEKKEAADDAEEKKSA